MKINRQDEWFARVRSGRLLIEATCDAMHDLGVGQPLRLLEVFEDGSARINDYWGREAILKESEWKWSNEPVKQFRKQ